MEEPPFDGAPPVDAPPVGLAMPPNEEPPVGVETLPPVVAVPPVVVTGGEPPVPEDGEVASSEHAAGTTTRATAE